MFLPVSWQQYFQLAQNSHQSAEKRAVNAIKTVSKPAKIYFRPCLGNSTYNRCKIATKVLKKCLEYPKTGFKASEDMFMFVSWQTYVRLTQKSHQSTQKEALNAQKQVSKPAKKIYCPYLCKCTSDRCKIATKVLKKVGECRKTRFKARKETFPSVPLLRYVW